MADQTNKEIIDGLLKDLFGDCPKETTAFKEALEKFLAMAGEDGIEDKDSCLNEQDVLLRDGCLLMEEYDKIVSGYMTKTDIVNQVIENIG